MKKNDNLDKAIINELHEEASNVIESNVIKIKLAEFHSVAYLDKLRKTTYKDKEVVFILPNGKEY